MDKRSLDWDSGVVGTDEGFEPEDADADEDEDEVNAFATSFFFSPVNN